MSGDVQPRKRKDKKKKKDDLGTEEPRGTAAALGEGDVFMHSYQDHGTGGHWCAKIIFFSLLAVLVTLIGLIILENRGLTELEANSVESRYSGVLEGWIEDAIDDHHDEHTLELKHHDNDEDHPDDQLDENEAEEESLEEDVEHNDDDEINEYGGESDEIEDEDDTQNEDEEDDTQNEEDDDEEDDTDNEDEDEDDERQNYEDEIEKDDDEEGETHDDEDEGQDEDSVEDDGKYDEIEENFKNEDDEEETYEHYSYKDVKSNENDENDDEDERDMEKEKDDYLSKESPSHYNYHESSEDDDDESKETKYDDEYNTEDEEEDDHGDDDDDDDEEEIEKIEKEIIDGDDSEEIVDTRAPASREKRDTSKETVTEDSSKDDEDDEPPIEKISRPQAGKPFVEIEEEVPVKPVDTLAEEEAYERQQEELRRQEEEAPHSLWLKLCVGGALLAATHALVRRATRVDAPETEEPVMEETPSLTDRRMTIVDEPIRVTRTSLSQTPRQIIDEEVFKKPAPVSQSAPIVKPKIEEEIVKEVVAKVLELPKSDAKKEEEKELYSEEEEEDEDEDIEEDNKLPQKTTANKEEAEDSEAEPEPEEVSDVEIIYDETVEEEEIPDEEIEEEEISDVDDTELLSRLEAKYGRLPEPERPGQHKGGGNSLATEWPGEPSDPYWRAQLDTAEEEFRQGRWAAAAARAGGGGLDGSGRARWLRARALDRAADTKRDNRLLADAVAAYLHLLKMNEALSDERLLEVARRTVDRIQFRGTYLRAEPVYRLLIRRFPDEVDYRNNLTILFLMANRADLAEEVLKETLRLWPNDLVALAHHGFVLKTHYNKLEEAIKALQKALDGDAGRANEPRFYYHLGDALLMLGRLDEAHEVHKRGTELGHFLSPSQRSLYNVPRLRAQPWWRVEETPYAKLARALENSWRDILKEGEAAVALYEQEKEGLKERGEWSQLDIFVRGREVGGRCARAPAVCAALRGEGEGCRRGQVKFSLMSPGTHVRPHVGPTNCRLRMHLALSNTEGTYIRVDKETRQWQVGKTLIFDDSFEHEVWHNGTGSRLVLIVDVWHPDLTAAEKRQLPAI